MSRHLTSIDISKTPDVLDLVEEVEATKKPRELRRDNKPVALLTPISENKEKWKKIKVSFGSWSDLDADELIATIYRWREEGSRPGTSECITHEYLN
jgi:antitoxin (DNA-binding transcriptional repressor) of toxin-antitoxin stability system